MNKLQGSPKKIAIIGGGVIGLTCALRLSETHNVDILAEKLGIESNSWKATAIWHVYLVPETKQVLQWAQQSLEVFCDLAVAHPESGIELVQGVELFRKGSPQTPLWAHIPKLFRILDEQEIAHYNNFDTSGMSQDDIALLRNTPVKWGYQVEAPAASMHKYLPWLENSVRNKPVNIFQVHINNFDELSSKYDLVVNCSGFGARELVSDTSFIPYKGQYFILRGGDSSPTEYVGDDDHPAGMAYAIPRSGEVMVGGCAEEGVEDLEFTLDWEDTKKRASLYVPWLRHCSAADQSRPPVVCIRPGRADGIRLEVDSDIASIPVVHNYGHGGSGFSLSWGCADTVKLLVDSM